MKVMIKFPGPLIHEGIAYDEIVETKDNITSGEFLESLNLNDEEIKDLVVIVNGKLTKKKLILKEGDEIIFLTPLRGG